MGSLLVWNINSQAVPEKKKTLTKGMMGIIEYVLDNMKSIDLY